MAERHFEKLGYARKKEHHLPKKMLYATVVLSLLVGGGCVSAEEESESLALGTTAQELNADNGLVFNGLVFNGLVFNGLVFNGLSLDALSSEDFTTWFESDPSLAGMLMKYVVGCAVPSGEVRTYTLGDITYTWVGELGLAPGWASGSPATKAEQQLVSACLAARGNKYGKSVPISLLGQAAQGQPIPYIPEELENYPEREACFFGNLFSGEGIFVGNDRGMLDAHESSARACALSSSATDTSKACPPLVHIGNCQSSCKKDPTGTWYVQCQHNGTTYLPITTRLRTQDVYFCGDGVCQFTEACGTDRRYDSCQPDCGLCSKR